MKKLIMAILVAAVVLGFGLKCYAQQEDPRRDVAAAAFDKMERLLTSPDQTGVNSALYTAIRIDDTYYKVLVLKQNQRIIELLEKLNSKPKK
jgi:hypothetical protein